jgi:hypothetical protein
MIETTSGYGREPAGAPRTSTAAPRPRPSSRASSSGHGDEPPGRGPRHRRRRPQGIGLRFRPAATYERASDQHGRLAVAAATNRLALGDKIRPTPATATRPSTSATGMSASATTASSSSGRSPRGVRCIKHTSGRRRFGGRGLDTYPVERGQALPALAAITASKEERVQENGSFRQSHTNRRHPRW